jgi:tetratricopeptide (TPR) repeat protein
VRGVDRRLMARKLLAFLLLGPAMLFGLYRCSYLPVRCSLDVHQCEKELVAAAERGEGYSTIVAARRALVRLQRCYVRPLQVDPPLLTALSYRFLQQHDLAIEWYQRTLIVDRRPEIYLGLGLEQLKAGRRAAAIENLTLACAFAPAVLDSIDDGIARQQVTQRIREQYGPNWLE